MQRNKLLLTGMVTAMLVSGAGSALAGGAVVFNPNWGCRTCTYSNGPALGGADMQAPVAVQAITLPSGEQIGAVSD